MPGIGRPQNRGMRFVLFALPALSLLVLGAHFMREGAIFLTSATHRQRLTRRRLLGSRRAESDRQRRKA